jgi:hypothetical protein
MVVPLDNAVYAVFSLGRNSYSKLFPTLEIELAHIELIRPAEKIFQKELEFMVIVTAYHPNRDSLGDTLNRDRPDGIKSKAGITPVDKVHPGTKDIFVRDVQTLFIRKGFFAQRAAGKEPGGHITIVRRHSGFPVAVFFELVYRHFFKKLLGSVNTDPFGVGRTNFC